MNSSSGRSSSYLGAARRRARRDRNEIARRRASRAARPDDAIEIRDDAGVALDLHASLLDDAEVRRRAPVGVPRHDGLADAAPVEGRLDPELRGLLAADLGRDLRARVRFDRRLSSTGDRDARARRRRFGSLTILQPSSCVTLPSVCVITGMVSVSDEEVRNLRAAKSVNVSDGRRRGVRPRPPEVQLSGAGRRERRPRARVARAGGREDAEAGQKEGLETDSRCENPQPVAPTCLGDRVAFRF